MNSHLVSQEQCPSCMKLGKDKSKDNLATYSDGHKWCYSCGYYKGSNGVAKFLSNQQHTISLDEVMLPEDCDIYYPQVCIDWISQYELNQNDLLINNVMWSNATKRLIFPIYGQENNLIAWQGRDFGGRSPKWYGRGNLKDTFNVLGNSRVRSLVLVEDVISAIKVSKVENCMPLYGCRIGNYRFRRIQQLYGWKYPIKIWLDPDKRKESVLEARIGKLNGLDCRIIFSDKDPKELSLVEINKILGKD